MSSFWSRFILGLVIVSSCSQLHHARPTFDKHGEERRNAGKENVDYNERRTVKRSVDAVGGQSSPADFSKRRFDRIEGLSSLGGLQKRVFDRIGDMSGLGGLSKKSSSELLDDRDARLLSNELRQRMQRAFDSIGGMSSFGGLSKKTAD